MAKFYGNFTFISCGNGCKSHLQSLIYDENGNPQDTDWAELERISKEHQTKCSTQTPYKYDPNAYYGNPDHCNGINQETGQHNYCEYEPKVEPKPVATTPTILTTAVDVLNPFRRK